jgi:hypothetical protein
MLAIKIDNPEIEQRVKEYLKKQHKDIKEMVNEAINLFLEQQQKLKYQKKDPFKHIHNIEYKDKEDLSDVQLYTNIDDSAKYIHSLRRK